MMMMNSSAGKRFRDAIEDERPLQIPGVINACCAKIAERAGFRALYLSGAGVANASFGLPDLAITTMNDVLEDARRITAVTSLPLLVDIDTGFGNALMIGRTIRSMIGAGVAAVHIEDQIPAKRCGHRSGKRLVSVAAMCDRLKAATDARTDSQFVIMARTDAIAGEGLEAAIERACCYIEAGADMIFPEAVTDLADYGRISASLSVPVLANMTEFGKSPLLTTQDLYNVGVRLVLYPLTAFRMMNFAANLAYETLRREGTQESLQNRMQTREELYDLLDYERLERMLDHEIDENKKCGADD